MGGCKWRRCCRRWRRPEPLHSAGHVRPRVRSYRVMTHSKLAFASVASARVRVPQEVVMRSVADEAVMLHLKTEQYFGLNPVGRRFVELMIQSTDVRSAVETLLDEYDVDE